MKKLTRTLSVLVVAVMLLSALSITVSASAGDIPYDAFADYGQQTFNVPASEGVKIDGVVSEGEYACTPIEVNKDSEGMAFLDWTAEGFPEEEISEILPYSIKYYVTYDKEGLYVAAEIVEASLYTRCDRKIDIWGLDSLEVDVAIDAFGDIEAGTFTQALMLDRVRATYALWDDGSGVQTPIGICYTGSSYGVYKTHTDMESDSYMVTRNEDKQLTTYEMFFYWEELYMDSVVPNQVFLNFQLHLGDARYLDYVADGYIACLGGLRYACRLSAEEQAELGTDNGMALHIFNLTDADKLNGNEPIEETTETDAVIEDETHAETDVFETEAPTSSETDAPVTVAPAVTTTEAIETEGTKSGCGASVGMSIPALFMAAAAFVALKKKD